MATRLAPEEIKTLRATLKMTEGEFATQLELEDRRVVKLLEAGKKKPTPHMSKLMMKLLTRHAGRSPRLKKILTQIRERAAKAV